MVYNSQILLKRKRKEPYKFRERENGPSSKGVSVERVNLVIEGHSRQGLKEYSLVSDVSCFL